MEAPVAPATPEPLGPTCGAPLVLIVEDHEHTRDMYSHYLRHVGMRVETAVTGEEAIVKARCFLPDVIVMDMSLPSPIEGDDAARELKADPDTCHIPIVAVTAYAFMGRQRALASGCDAYYRKPFLPRDLAMIVAGLAKRDFSA